LTVDPHTYDVKRTFAKCDALLKVIPDASATAQDLFTELGNQWNGTNDARVTPQSVWACMYAPYAPQEPRLAHASRTGSFIGHTAPVLLASGALI
jgi:hypothetical protein